MKRRTEKLVMVMLSIGIALVTTLTVVQMSATTVKAYNPPACVAETGCADDTWCETRPGSASRCICKEFWLGNFCAGE